MMRQAIITSIFILTSCQTQAVNTKPYLEDAQKTAKAFMQQLSGTLKQQIQTEGIVSAIPFCKEVAPAIAMQHSTDFKTVKRVSTKARNRTQGIPDEWEQQALTNLTQQISAEPTDAPNEVSQITTENGAQYYRYAKAITVQGLCLQCHGQPKDISAEVIAALDKHYPNDIARGYKVGDLRGAVSIKYKLD